jgi:hypothetical protein
MIRMFKADDGTIDRVAKCVDIAVKVSLIVASIIAIWKIYLFQETTQIISSSIETRPLASGDKKYAEVILKVTNSGKVRVTLVAGMLRLRSLERGKLTFRLKGSTEFAEQVLVPNVFVVDVTKAAYPSDVAASTHQPDFLQSGSLFFDPGETIKMCFLVEYKGSGLCNIVTRYDGDQEGSLWFEEQYEILEDRRVLSNTKPTVGMNVQSALATR